MSVALIVLGLCQMASACVMLFASWGARLELFKAAPDYAARLYQPVADQIFLGYWPLRSRVLFREPVPPQITNTVRMLRGIYAAHWVLFALFSSCVLAFIVSAIADW